MEVRSCSAQCQLAGPGFAILSFLNGSASSSPQLLTELPAATIFGVPFGSFPLSQPIWTD